MTLPPKPASRPDHVSLWRYAKLFRQDILSAQPERLYRARMAEFRTPFFRSFLINQPDLIQNVLQTSPQNFPKSDRISEGLRPLLGDAVFVTNGPRWRGQRALIDPAFQGGRVRASFPAMWAAADAMVARLAAHAPGETVEVETEASHVAADVIFRALFSVPIEDETARAVFQTFQIYQRAQPLLNLAALLPLPRVFPRLYQRRTRQSARQIRALITQLVEARRAQLDAGTAPDDLVTKIMTAVDPATGQRFDAAEMIDQVAIFFLAGHETSASALAWALYLMALYPDWQDRLAAEAQALCGTFSDVSKLTLSRDVFRETLRLYPPVPMMVREAKQAVRFRNRLVPRGAQIVISLWHLHRHQRLWHNPDAFDPDRWRSDAAQPCPKEAFLPFSSGERVCPGAGFAMIEGPLLLSRILRDFRVSCDPGRRPVPVAHLTVRSKSGIWLKLAPREVL
ncbi:MAG: cytochrome P450 [Pseudomonadota bacterium]